jgi:acyl dehydratase
MKIFPRLADLQGLTGQSLGLSDWILVEQARIDAFAAATEDHQWIHTDPVRASGGPFGTTVGHGFLTLSLLPAFIGSAFALGDTRLMINYGLNRVRFTAPVPVGSRLRAQFSLLAWEALKEGVQLTVEATVEREGATKPVCIAESLLRCYP